MTSKTSYFFINFLMSEGLYLCRIHFSVEIETLCFFGEYDRYIEVLCCDTGDTDTGCFNCKNFGNGTVREAAFKFFADFIDESDIHLMI